MRVAQVGPLIYQIPPEKYGGTELVVYNIIKGLKEEGVDCTLFASEGSKVEAQVVPICPPLTWFSCRKQRFMWAYELCTNTRFNTNDHFLL
jgi:hypothetical protein